MNSMRSRRSPSYWAQHRPESRSSLNRWEEKRPRASCSYRSFYEKTKRRGSSDLSESITVPKAEFLEMKRKLDEGVNITKKLKKLREDSEKEKSYLEVVSPERLNIKDEIAE